MTIEKRYKYRIKIKGKPDFVGYQATIAMMTKRLEIISRKNEITSVEATEETEDK